MNNQYSASEIHRLLKINPDLSEIYQPEQAQDSSVSTPISSISAGPAAEAAQTQPSGAPFDLPVFSQLSGEEASEMIIMPSEKAEKRARKAQAQAAAGGRRSGWSGAIVYPLIFILSFAFFYAALNYNSLWAQFQSWFTQDEDEQILQADLDKYYDWIGGYYFAVGDREKLEPNNDLDKDGLTNLDEYWIRTNPTLFDSDSDGTSDGIEVINGGNPWGQGQMTSKQKKSLSKIDLIKLNNRISLNAAANNPDSLGKHSDNFDLSRPARLTVPKLQIQAPIVWTEDPVKFDEDLTKGVVHYPGTALPGESGVVYISGHSSDYFWKNHPYRQIFARINSLEPGDDIFVEVYGKDGKVYNFKYRVVSENVYSPDDQRQFTDSGAKLNLSTCWPIGTQKDRYIVSAELQEL
jgi:sortase A